ncbi:MAG: aminoglycoside phosphotransferase family protein [Epsilonproteobacteria bacterium]|nr:aminoglycoside phosphotransferase family protein [Campylobacterota bacterium]
MLEAAKKLILSTNINANHIQHVPSCDHFVLQADQQWIFRFAKDHMRSTILQREVQLLKQLAGKTTLPIPEVIFEFNSPVGFGYKKIDGQILTPADYNQLSSYCKDHFAQTLAQFLFELHTPLPRDALVRLHIPASDWPLPSQQLTQKLEHKLHATALQNLLTWTLREYTQIQTEQHDTVLLHHDLYHNNIAFDTERNVINGIFDFSDAALGDPYIDFRYLFLLDARLAHNVGQRYANLTGQPYSPTRTTLYYLATEFSRLASSIESSCVMQDCRQIMQRLLKFEKPA